MPYTVLNQYVLGRIPTTTTEGFEDAITKTASDQMPPKLSSQFVVAIDFGTTFSGYAFSSMNDFLRDPLTRIHTHTWKAGELLSEKTPTTLLLNDKQELRAFGYDAETEYSRMVEEEQKRHFYFRRFKMMLYSKDGKLMLTRDTLLKDMTDKEMKAIEVFRHSIQYLREHFLLQLKEKELEKLVEVNTEINWVLTVPAIWDDPAKQFMREAAVNAGIPGDKLIICLEPEAASVYCKFLPLEKLGQDSSVEVMKPGRKFVVLDAGGGTIDMAVQEVRDDGKLQEIARVQGGDWGGIYVDEAFKEMLSEIISKPILEEYRLKNTTDYLELFRFFESKKREKQTSKKVRMLIPSSLVTFIEENTDNTLSQLMKKNTIYGQSVDLKRDKMSMNIEVFQQFFDTNAAQIISKVKELLTSDKTHGTDVILMVGGFSQSDYLQAKIKEAFQQFKVVIPPESGLAVLRGAVLFGHDPNIIAARVAKHTYGVGTNVSFDDKKHPLDKKKEMNGKLYCTDVFDRHVRQGDTIYIDETPIKKTYTPIYPDQTSVNLKVYISSCENPQYTDDKECKHVASLEVPMPNVSGGVNRKVTASFTFGGTEIKVEGTDETTHETVDIKLDFLDGVI